MNKKQWEAPISAKAKLYKENPSGVLACCGDEVIDTGFVKLTLETVAIAFKESDIYTAVGDK